MTNFILGIVIAAIIICIVAFIIISLQNTQLSRLNSDNFSIEALTYSPGFKKVIDTVIPAGTDKEYIKAERLISDSGVNISMRELYFWKIAIPVLLLIICLSIYFINKNIYIDAIISDRLVETVNVMGSTSEGKTAQESKEEQERQKAAKDTYLIMENLVDTRMLKKSDSVTARLEIQEKLMESGEVLSKADAASMANELYNKWLRVENEKQVSPLTMVMILFISLIGFMVPNTYLEVVKFMRYQAFDNEVIALEMLTILVGSIENITVKEILKILEENSKVYKKNFEKALLEYPIDFEQALINLGNSSKNKDFQALISTLRQCATSDKYAALQTLQRRRISRKEYRKMTEEKKIETKMMVGMLLLMPVLLCLAKLLLGPWAELMTGSGIF